LSVKVKNIIAKLDVDISVVTELCQLGVKEGNPYAQYVLGLYYENGIGVQADIKKALESLELYERAAEQGFHRY